MKHIPQLDGLRAVAVSMVLLTHFWVYPESWPTMNLIAASGWMGVDLFFVLSGYLITGILWASRDKPGYFKNFYARRSLRIFPLYYAVLAVVFLALPLATTLPDNVVADRAFYWLYLSNFALAAGWQLFALDITWSLAIEEQFYLIWPAVTRWVTKRALTIACVALIVLAPIARTLLWPELGWRWLHMMMPLRADAFAVGALLALYPISAKIARVVAIAGLTLVTALVLSGVYARDSQLVGCVGYSLNAITAGAVMVTALSARFLAWSPFTYVGKVSYGVYLLHPLVLIAVSTVTESVGLDLHTLTGTAIDPILFVIVLSLATLVVASASFYLFEARFLAMKGKFVPVVRPGVVPSIR